MDKLSSKEREWLKAIDPSRFAEMMTAKGWRLKNEYQDVWIKTAPNGNIWEIHGNWKALVFEMVKAVAEFEDWSVYEALYYFANGKRLVTVLPTTSKWENPVK